MIVLERSWGLNEGEKEKEGGGDRDGTMCVEEEGDSVEKKKNMYGKKKKIHKQTRVWMKWKERNKK